MSSTTTHSADVHLQSTEMQVLLVGDWGLREFAAAIAGSNAALSWPRLTHITHACDQLASSESPPELIFLAQPAPAAFRQADIDRLQQLSPLTRLVIVAGTWCEGELRTGTPLRGVIRLYWYEWKSWWAAAKRRQDVGDCPHWSQPLEHPQSGRWAGDELAWSTLGPTPNVLIDCDNFATYETLSAGLKAYRMDSHWNRTRSTSTFAPPQAGIWDGGQLHEGELQHLAEFCQLVDGPVVAMLDFPRVEHLNRVQSAGAAASFAKPYVVEELVRTLRCC